MEILMGVMMAAMIIGFIIWGPQSKMMTNHDKECPKEEHVIKHDGQEKEDCKAVTGNQKASPVDKERSE